MALTNAELAALETLKNMPARNPKTATERPMIPPNMGEIPEPSVADLMSLLENNLQEMNFISDEIIKHPDLKDTNVITFMSKIKGQLLTMGRDINEIKRGTYRAGSEIEPTKGEGGESYIMPEVMPGESLTIKKPLPPGESYVSPMAQRLFT